MRRWVVPVLLSAITLHACAAPDRADSSPDFERIAGAPLENVIVVAPDVISGGQPEGDEAFNALADMGVRTIISVDGARPDVEAADARGMRYVHLPIGYDTVPDERRLEIARALRDLPGPVYLHCHHGVHRGPAAAAAGLATLGAISPETGEAFLVLAGTSPSYPGLFASVRDSAPATDAELDAASDEFPSVAEVGGFVEAMAAADRAFDHLELLASSGWRAPSAHPDLVAAAEAGFLADALRAALDDAAGYDPDIGARLAHSVDLTQRLEALLLEERSDATAALLVAIETDCRACHRVYRNTR